MIQHLSKIYESCPDTAQATHAGLHYFLAQHSPITLINAIYAEPIFYWLHMLNQQMQKSLDNHSYISSFIEADDSHYQSIVTKLFAVDVDSKSAFALMESVNA